MTSVGGYQLEAEIGAGSSGTVWKAFRQGPIVHPVALKRLRAASGAVDVQRMRREASVLAELDHPHIVRVIEILEDGEGVAVAMQYAPGGSLETLLEERGTLDPGEVVAVAAPLANALASAHRHGTVHGDVKPANVLFTSDGEPLLSDFGSVRTLGQMTSESFASTPEYVAPELVEGAFPDPRADVYSLAVVCYHALTGTPPYTGDSPLAIVRAADMGSFQPLTGRPDIPPALAQVIERGMARDPGWRFESAEAFGQALRSAVPPDQVRLPGVPAWAAISGEDSDAKGTVVFGPRPPRPEPQQVRQRKRMSPFLPLSLSAIVIVAGLTVLGGVLLLRALRSSGDSCPEVERPPVGPDGQVVTGDPDGSGCEVYGAYQPMPGQADAMIFRIHLDGEVLRFRLGAPGDQVVLGDWDCDGIDTLGHYLRSDGLVHYYDGWAAEANEPLDPFRETRVAADGDASVVSAEDNEGDGSGEACEEEIRVTEEGEDTATPAVGDCVHVSEQGAVLGSTPCDAPDSGPYRVAEVADLDAGCAETQAAVRSGDSALCLEANLLPGLCYRFPPLDDEDRFVEDGYMTLAGCEEEGVTEVIEVIPGTLSPDQCPTDEDWDRYFYFEEPLMVACVLDH